MHLIHGMQVILLQYVMEEKILLQIYDQHVAHVISLWELKTWMTLKHDVILHKISISLIKII